MMTLLRFLGCTSMIGCSKVFEQNTINTVLYRTAYICFGVPVHEKRKPIYQSQIDLQVIAMFS